MADRYILVFTGSQVDNALAKILNNQQTAGKVLTSDGDGGCEWETPTTGKVYTGVQGDGVAVNNTNDTIGLTVGAVPVIKLKRPTETEVPSGKGIIVGTRFSGVHWEELEMEGDDLKSSGEDVAGKVLVTDGNGGTEWESSPAFVPYTGNTPVYVDTDNRIGISGAGAPSKMFLCSPDATSTAQWNVVLGTDIWHLEGQSAQNKVLCCGSNGYMYYRELKPECFV